MFNSKYSIILLLKTKLNLFRCFLDSKLHQNNEAQK